MNWKLTENDIWLKVDFDTKESVKELGAKYDADKKRWFIPRGSNPFDFRKFWRVLDCPFDEKDRVKKMGAKWDPVIKKWFVPQNLDFDDFSLFWPKDLQKFIFDDRFIAHQEIKSGQSSVFKSKDQQNSGWFAVKLYPSISEDKSKSIAFNRELKNLMEVLEGIPSVLPIESWNRHEASEGNFYVTEWCDLGSLNEYLGRDDEIEVMARKIVDVYFEAEGPEEEREIIESIVAEIQSSSSGDAFVDNIDDLKVILRGLRETYEKGVIHRDVKPDNIYLKINPEMWELSDEEIDRRDDSIQFILGDFGSSKLIEDTYVGHTQTTVDWRTEPWGPERSRLEKQFQETWDVYSWGAIAVAIIAKRRFKTDEELAIAIDEDLKATIPDAFYSIIKKCLHEDPSERYQNVVELDEAIKRNGI